MRQYALENRSVQAKAVTMWSWLALPLAAACFASCDSERKFDAAAWRSDAMTENHQVLDVRRSMTADIQERFRPGTSKTEILATFGPAEHDVAECNYPGVDNCLGYDLGVTTIDYTFLVFAFSGERLVHVSESRG